MSQVTAAQPQGLIGVLLDRTNCFEDRVEAATDLGEYDDPIALEALARVAVDGREDESILEHCGESIAEIWNRRRIYDPELSASLAPRARAELELILDPTIPRA